LFGANVFLIIGLQNNRRGMLAPNSNRTTAETADFPRQIAIEPNLGDVKLALTARNLRPEHLNAHALGFTNQILHPTLTEITLTALQAVAIEVQVKICWSNEHGRVWVPVDF